MQADMQKLNKRFYARQPQAVIGCAECPGCISANTAPVDHASDDLEGQTDEPRVVVPKALREPGILAEPKDVKQSEREETK
jgi:hypothetical protein